MVHIQFHCKTFEMLVYCEWPKIQLPYVSFYKWTKKKKQNCIAVNMLFVGVKV